MRREGRVVYYGRERQAVYDRLRAGGFGKSESRRLSRIKHSDDQPILDSMITERSRFLRRFQDEVVRQGWTQGQARYHYYRAIRTKMVKSGFFRRPDPIMALFHSHENKLARQRGWVKGSYDPEHPEERRVRRRTKHETPPSKGRGKGQVKAQKARANARKKAIRARENVGKLRIDILEREVKLAPSGIAATRDPAIRGNLRIRYRELSKRLDSARARGARYG